MHDILANPITWIVIAALSEIIALSPLKETPTSKDQHATSRWESLPPTLPNEDQALSCR